MSRRRRFAIAAISPLVALALTGCHNIHRPWARTETTDPDRALEAPQVRTARDAVPDSVMLRDKDRGSFTDFPQ